MILGTAGVVGGNLASYTDDPGPAHITLQSVSAASHEYL